MNYHLTRISRNRKTGPIPVSTTSAESCPPSCPLSKGGCYAKGGPLAMHWQKVTEAKRGTSFERFLHDVRTLPKGQLWRHNQAGDLPGSGDSIDGRALNALVDANRGRKGFTYTHKPVTRENQKKIKQANAHGFTVNLSANNLKHADMLANLAIGPVVVVLPSDVTQNVKTPHGRTVVVCPATRSEEAYANASCATCGLCSRADRPTIVGFPAHGSSLKKASVIAKGN